MRADGSVVDQKEWSNETRLAFRRSLPAPKQLPQPTVRKPSAAVGKTITEIGLRYAASRSLRAANLSVTEWIALFQANIEIESAYRPDAQSHVGAIGLGQLMPGTAKELGVDPHNMEQNLDGSARYLLSMLGEFGTPELALAAYNAGPGAVRKHGGIPPFEETRGHVRKVMTVWMRLKKKDI